MTIPAHGANFSHTVYTTLVTFLSNSPDKPFTYSHAPDAAGHNPGDDLTPYPIPYDYILQGTHSTPGGYVDTINANLKTMRGGGYVVLRLFSVSNIHGALGDNGQNYKTLDYLVTTALSTYGKLGVQIVHGCGMKSF